ncbi:hypothetical protein CpipJ_CPIJ006089 [Culex quinquefasciatus]|uniref:Uncharacterized protein n=1 Tax=Culex quinquefasciatus TaxID=7176 RepID=B0WGY8_CULQU|nr:hypothetical protein CpipJ_CPIJ006089 [Culex quinquefasciatus]|eukprot:XP_001847972.1 hypothetical protein CpipJ_CPIJ006089 [Culex quinquefasciatus]
MFSFSLRPLKHFSSAVSLFIPPAGRFQTSSFVSMPLCEI